MPTSCRKGLDPSAKATMLNRVARSRTGGKIKIYRKESRNEQKRKE